MKRFDLYGQLVVIALSYLPFKNVYSDDYIANWLYHGLFLIVLAIWQIISTLSNIINYNGTSNTKVFKLNLQIAAVYFVIYFSYIFVSGLSHGFLIPSLILADILIIRYWVVLKKYYQL